MRSGSVQGEAIRRTLGNPNPAQAGDRGAVSKRCLPALFPGEWV